MRSTLRLRARQWFWRTLLKFLRWTHDRWPSPEPHFACPFCGEPTRTGTGLKMTDQNHVRRSRRDVLYIEDDDYFARQMIAAMEKRGLRVVWCQTFDGAMQASSTIDTNVCVADYDLGVLSEGHTGLDFLSTYDGRKILFSGNPPLSVPDDVEVFTKAKVLDLIDDLSAPEQPIGDEES